MEFLTAVALVVGLSLAGGLLAPATIDPSELGAHPGETVALEGRIARVEPTGDLQRVRLEGNAGHAWVLARGEVPALGSRVRVIGDAAVGREGPVLWMDGDWTVLGTPERAPIGVDRAAHAAPEHAGETLAVVGLWDADAEQLTGESARLATRIRAAPPPPGATILAWGVLSYDPASAAYRLEATGWSPWSPPSA